MSLAVRPGANVVQVYGFCIDAPDRKLRIVMELCSHGSLRAHLKALPREQLTLPYLVDICLQLTSGLLHLHNCGVLHRDLKTDNALVVSQDPLVVKWADFGCGVKLEAPSAAGATYSAAGATYSAGMPCVGMVFRNTDRSILIMT